MWLNRIVLIFAFTMICQLEGYHLDKDMPLGRHRRKGRLAKKGVQLNIVQKDWEFSFDLYETRNDSNMIYTL